MNLIKILMIYCVSRLTEDNLNETVKGSSLQRLYTGPRIGQETKKPLRNQFLKPYIVFFIFASRDYRFLFFYLLLYSIHFLLCSVQTLQKSLEHFLQSAL